MVPIINNGYEKSIKKNQVDFFLKHVRIKN